MIKAVIIDDEPLAISIVREYLEKFSNIEVAEECHNGFDGFKAIAHHKPDLIFLDIQMPKINGFEMMELIENPPPVIFTTAFDEYAIKAFETHAVDYLLKPFSEDRFEKAVAKFMQQHATGTKDENIQKLLESKSEQLQEQARVVVKSGSNIKILSTHDIHYFEAYDDYVKIITADDCFLKKTTMSAFEASMNPSQFVRVHRSYLLNVHELTRIEPNGKDNYNAILRSGAKVPLSKTGYPRLKELLKL